MAGACRCRLWHLCLSLAADHADPDQTALHRGAVSSEPLHDHALPAGRRRASLGPAHFLARGTVGMMGPRHDRRTNGATERLPITRRGFLLLGMQTAVAGALAWRIRRFQMVEHERYRLLAEENRISMRLIAPARGKIFDRSGE